MKVYLEIRFYLCLAIATGLLFTGLYLPPEGDIKKNVVFAAGMVMAIGGLCVGLDIKGILHEIGEIIKEGHRYNESLTKLKGYEAGEQSES